ncbi:HNH endonuclease family protein [Streptomyces rhizosphaericola]|uniref:HNH endonuclease n=1 Tax=Streptomyces rhizosphaericola TaxID=2564098 RepID=A0ABY2P825_9ACTN|nr:HNH endonuclease family protein [Streptomyces rhizosphaericola]TGZ01884.1 HNH endonuclease [Streptomyces rhizosphaericola]
MTRRQSWWRRGLAVGAVFALAGCAAIEDATQPEPADGKPSASASASTGAGGGGGTAADDSALPGIPTAEQARKELAGLTVAKHGSMSGYSRAKFPHWASQGESCDTRETVLERDGTDVERDDQCRAVSGKWTSVYDDKAFTEARDLDIDHMVPLANAWRSGARTWTQEKRKEFANDLARPQLLAVSAATNRSKGDQGPDEWQPPSKAYWCTYSRAWVSVKASYELSVTEAEKETLTEMLDTCGS